jgi:flavodoxin
MKSLVIYYSKTGNTKAVAEAIAQELGADTEEIREAGRRRGNVRSAFDAIFRRMPAIQAMSHSLSDYDLVVVGTPIWAQGPAPAVQVFLSSADLQGKSVALFCTMGGMGDKRTFAKMEGLLTGSRIIARLSFDQQETSSLENVAERVKVWTRELLDRLSNQRNRGTHASSDVAE